MANSSYYTYKKYVTYHSQQPLPYIPVTYSVDGEGTLPLRLKDECDVNCGCVTLKFKVDSDEVNCNGSPILTTSEFGNVLNTYPFPPSHYVHTMEIGDCVETIESLGKHTYYLHCGNTIVNNCAMEFLSGLTLSDSVKKIESGAFYFAALKDVELNDGLEYVGSEAFGTSKISHLVYPDTIDYVGMNVLSGSPVEYVEFISETPPTTMYRPQENIHVIPIYVPSGSVNTYRQAFPSIADEIMPTNQRIKLATIDMTQFQNITTRPEQFLMGYNWYATANNQHTIKDADVANLTKLCGGNGKGIIFGNINIGSGVTLIDFKAFSTGNDSLTTTVATSPRISNITFDSGSSLEVIADGAFYGAGLYIDELRLPDSLQSIGYRAFCSPYNGCIGNIFIPSSVTSIGDEAFSRSGCHPNCYFESPTPYSGISKNMFGRIENKPSAIYVPSSGVDAYREYFSAITVGMLERSVVHAWDKAVLTFTDDTTYTISGNGEDNISLTETINKRSNLKSVVINNSITSITSSAFVAATNLTAVTLPNTLKVIEQSAFYECTGLESFEIPSGVTDIGFGAFNYCSGLTGITVNAITPPTIVDNSFDNTNNCPIFVPAISFCEYKSADNWEHYANRLQTIGGEPHSECSGYSGQYLTFRAIEDCTFGFSGSVDRNILSYSVDSGLSWTKLANNANTPTVASGDTIIWNASGLSTNDAHGNYGIGTFSSTGKFEVEGNIMTLVSGNNPIVATTMADYQFLGLFSGCTGLTSAENLSLPSALTRNCYQSMFSDCTNLTSVPALPATALTRNCYQSMFSDCTSLTTAPTLPATTLANSCYQAMFKDCTSLTTAPNLPATTLTGWCYSSMFANCTSLTTAPELPATTLDAYCYSNMFQGCTSLTTAPVLSATTLAGFEYYEMFYDCTSLNSITCLATYIPSEYCTYWWLINVAQTGTFVKAASMNRWPTGASGIPDGWTVVDYQE